MIMRLWLGIVLLTTVASCGDHKTAENEFHGIPQYDPKVAAMREAFRLGTPMGRSDVNLVDTWNCVLRRAWGRSESVHNFELRFGIHIPNGLIWEAKLPGKEWGDWGKLSLDENEHLYLSAMSHEPVGNVICVKENFYILRVTGPEEFTYESSDIYHTSICAPGVETVPSLVDQRRHVRSYTQCKLNN